MNNSTNTRTSPVKFFISLMMIAASFMLGYFTAMYEVDRSQKEWLNSDPAKITTRIIR